MKAKSLLLGLLLIGLSSSMLGAQSNLNYPGRYMGQEATKTMTAPNGAVLSASLVQATQLVYTEP